ncbi:MAG: LptF/LptG family permease [Alphaproteobacteria bacterium]
MTFALYLTRIFALSVGVALLALGALAELLDLLDNGNAVIARDGRLGDLGSYAALIMPSIAASVVPIATLIGALITFGNLAVHNEIVAMRSSGMTIYWIVGRLAPVTLVIGLVYFGVRFVAAPYTEILVHEMLREPEPAAQADLDTGAAGMPGQAAYWISSGPMIMGFERAEDEGRRMQHVTLIRRGPDGRIVSHATARTGRLIDGVWQFDGVTARSINREGASKAQAGALTLADGPEPVDILSATILNARVRLHQPGLPEAKIWAGGNSPGYYLTNFYEALAAPFVPMIMLLAAAPLALGTSRYPSRARDMAVALAAGFGYLLASGVFRSLGESGVMPPVLAVGGPVLIFMLATSSILAHREG